MLYGSIQAEDTPLLENKHEVADGSFKAAVFGFSDGLTTNISLVLGIALAHQDHRAVVLVGMAGLFAGASSMACGEWLSERAERDSHRRQLELEESHLRQIPDEEARHMREILVECGLSRVTADLVNNEVMKLPIPQQLAFHAKFELGIDPEVSAVSTCSALRNAATMWLAFALGALVPVLPWIVLPEDPGRRPASLWASVVASLFAMVLATLYQVQGHYRDMVMVMMRQVLVTALAVGCTVLFEHLFSRK